MYRTIASGLVLALLTGCATFSRPDADLQTYVPERDTTPVSLRQMQLLVPGEWYVVRLPDQDGRSAFVRGIFRHGYVGRLEKSDEGSLTLTDVTKCTLFDSTSSLRHLPLFGSEFENGWMDCENQPAPVTVPQARVMWFESISAEDADRFRRYKEIVKVIVSTPLFETATNDGDSTSQTAQLGVLDRRWPDASFLLPHLKREEVVSQRRIEIREMQPGQWYSVIIPIKRPDGSNDFGVHVGIVDHLDDDSVNLTNVTSGTALGGAGGSQTSSEMRLRYAQIQLVKPLTQEQVTEQIAMFNQPRKSMTAQGE